MNLLAVSLRNVRIRLLSSVLTTISIAVGVGLLASLWLLVAELDRGYKASIGGFRAIVGSKDGSPLEIVMNTVLNLREPRGLIKLSVYEELHDNELKAKYHVRYAIPQARGDSWESFPIIGTTDEMFSKFEWGGKDKHLGFAQGESWEFGHADLMQFAADKAELARHIAEHESNGDGHDHKHTLPIPAAWRRAVVGAKVARRHGIQLGDELIPTHGRKDEVGAHLHEDFPIAVAGILEPTRSPIDASIFIPLAAFLSMDGHEAVRETDGAEPGDVLISAVVCRPVHHMGPRNLELLFQTRADAQIALPEREIPDLMRIVGSAKDLVQVLSYLVLFVAGAATLVAIYNTMNERRREIAIMRALGARRHQILRVILQESVVISLVGGVLGVIGCHAAAWAFSDVLEELAGVAVDWSAFSVVEIWLILGAGGLGGLAGVLPAVKGSMTEVASHLGPIS